MVLHDMKEKNVCEGALYYHSVQEQKADRYALYQYFAKAK